MVALDRGPRPASSTRGSAVSFAERLPEREATFKVNTAKTSRSSLVHNGLDKWFKGGFVDNYFQVTQRGSSLSTEIRAGVTTFLTAGYIMAVNPNIISTTGLDFEGVVFATAASSFVSTLIMGLCANLPFGLWPGMGMNAYFAYTVVGFKGTGQAVKRVMFAVVMEGALFIGISALDLRRYIFTFFPAWLMKATMAGIGLFLAFIGLQAGNGVDLIRDHPATLVDVSSLSGEHYARTWIGIAFFCLMALLIMLKVKGAVIICIALSTILCWTLEGLGTPQFSYEPVCCLGSVAFPTPTRGQPETEFFPKPGGGWLPRPLCENAYVLRGRAEEQEGGEGARWTGETAADHGNGSFTVLRPDGSSFLHTGSLQYSGNWSGRDSAFAGGCSEVCQLLFGEEGGGNGSGGGASGGRSNPACDPDAGQVSLVETSCWPSLSHQDRADPELVVDPFGEGCIGGAGRIPKTFKHPTSIVGPPKIELAGKIVPPFFGWEGCGPWTNNTPGECVSGDVEGGTIWAFDLQDLTWENFGSPLLTLLYVDYIGTMGFLYAAADLSGLIDPRSPETFPGVYWAFMADALGTFIGGFLGTSSVTTYGESMAGVYEGGRTGLTALVIAFFNFLCMFLAPLLSSIPTVSTGPALVMVGVFMIEGVKDIDWQDYMQAIPSVICILFQVATYHIEYGVIAGFFVWMFMMICSLRIAIWIPPLWRALPRRLKRFVAEQDGDEIFRERLAMLGYCRSQKT